MIWAGAALCVGDALACGPGFPSGYLDAPEAQVLAVPEAIFAEELLRLLPEEGRSRVRRSWALDRAGDEVDVRERMLTADVAELAEALKASGKTEEEIERLTAEYRAVRDGSENETNAPDVVPAGLPPEFDGYLRGALAWRKGDFEEARRQWRALMELPEENRRHRSTWAAYMMGRSHQREVRSEWSHGAQAHARAAAVWFGLTRQLAGEGHADVLGLAAESWGWEAKAALDSGDEAQAIRLYLKQLGMGDATAVQSLRAAAKKVSYANPEKRVAFAKDPVVRAVLVAYLVSKGGPSFDGGWSDDWSWQAQDWARRIHQEGGAEVRSADRLAWLAYEGGFFNLAEEWLTLAPDEVPEANWLRAKLALRAGDLSRGARFLERAAKSDDLSETHRNDVYGELGYVLLADQKPESALIAWVNGDHWLDAAYVAERVLALDELARLVDEWSTLTASRQDEEEPSHKYWGDLRGTLRSLLARRLARAGQNERATGYFNEDLRAVYVRYVADVRLGFDLQRPERERADAFWRAARLVRERGMELLATELEPDWAVWGGGYDSGSSAADRMEVSALAGGVFAPSKLEIDRINAHRVPEHRFHYRYRAAELAGWAASLMPNDDDETARVLWTAGQWLAARDPKAAKPFYQALVIRCGNTALGREAAKRRWFPDHLAERFAIDEAASTVE